MTDEFIADPYIRERYGISEGATFESSFSRVSLESILFGIVASATYVIESIFDTFARDVDKKIASSIVATIPWYHKICMDYQHGDQLKLNPSTYEFEYEVVDESKQCVKYAACRDLGGGVDILVAGRGSDGFPEALPEDVLSAFTAYINQRKVVGVVATVSSKNPDEIKIPMTIQYDPTVLNDNGSLISNPEIYPVEDAINGYLANIIYGGKFNINKLIDSVQNATGVQDLQVGSIETKPAEEEEFSSISGNNYESIGGSFRSLDLRNSISYVLTI